MAQVIYTFDNGNCYATFDNRQTIIWNKRWIKLFDVAYSITATITNGTITDVRTISGGQTVNLTITPNEGYVLPESVTVTNATSSYNAETGVLTLSKPTADVTIVAECEAETPLVVKGQIINVDMTGSGTAQQYRVLKVNGKVAEVLAMSNASSQQFASSGQTYENSILDTYLNTTWYGTLSATAKAAIVDKTFKQDSWYLGTSGNPDYQGKYTGSTAYQVSLGSASFGNEITRHAYAIGVQDVLDYLEVTPQMTSDNTTLTDNNVWTMFWNSTTTHSGNIWLRSATASDASYALYVFGYYGNLRSDPTYNSTAVRPAFQLDLSKISWS